MKNVSENGFVQDLYEKSPLFVRCFILFFYKYIFLLGFLDGKSGLAYGVSHNIIYRLDGRCKNHYWRYEISR